MRRGASATDHNQGRRKEAILVLSGLRFRQWGKGQSPIGAARGQILGKLRQRISDQEPGDLEQGSRLAADSKVHPWGTSVEADQNKDLRFPSAAL